MKSQILVGNHTFKQMDDLVSCDRISNSKDVSGTIFHLNTEYVITGSLSSGLYGVSCYWGNQVIDLNFYDGQLKPLKYAQHWLEVSAGLRARGYSGMLVTYKGRKLVMLNEVEFKCHYQVKQLELF